MPLAPAIRPKNLLNKSQLAHALGRNASYISAMVKSGYRLQYGTLTTRKHALGWLSAHPDFRVGDAYPRNVEGRKS